MIGIKENHKNEALNDLEWETMGSFISNFAKNNESVTDETLSEKSDFIITGNKKEEFTEKFEKIKSSIENTSSKSNQKSSNLQKPLAVYDTLQSDIRNLLDELQEIKQARINLQTKLNTIRQ
ncbi:MAG: hypothetical protein OEV78_10695 [Spirochaetia bacterium]|nr:hypothetical protein [Spirochaetia bacterium]